MTSLKLKKIGIDTYKENIVYLSHRCELCKSQGFQALSKIEVVAEKPKKHRLLATLNICNNGLLTEHEVGLSQSAFSRFGVSEGTEVSLKHPTPLSSTDLIRKKLEGHPLTKQDFLDITEDIVGYRYSNVELTAFVVACSSHALSIDEITALTEAMIETGQSIDWKLPLVLDKHCIGGIPGNRTTMIVVPIIAAYGLPIPKTSSRAITSPAGTADTMEALTNVTLSLSEMKQIVKKHGACIGWGGALALAPVDDIIISVERALNIDSEAQMVASILSKKKAAGATHVLIDIPVGKTAKIRSSTQAAKLKKTFEIVGGRLGMKIRVVLTDGSEPIGRGVGPNLEAMDVLNVLEGRAEELEDLKEKSIRLAGELLALSGAETQKSGIKIAREILESGAAAKKLIEIAKAQGSLKTPQYAAHRFSVKSKTSGTVKEIHNLKIAKIAKLAGAPQDPAAGLFLEVKVGTPVKKGQVLFTIFSETESEMRFAKNYVRENSDIVTVGG